ncbi:MAG: NAD-dependent epimerase/dehydratase family protein [Candidatus Omnitrophota bacterium]
MKNFWRNKRVLITGAGGFLGSWICEALVHRGSQVLALVKEERSGSPLNKLRPRLYSVVKESITDFEKIKGIFLKERPDVCFHLAAQPLVGLADQSPLGTFETNITGTWNILEASRMINIKSLIIASTYKAQVNYGSHRAERKASPLSLHPYDTSKACSDLLARTYFSTYGLPLAVTRSCNIYGGGDLNFSRIIPSAIKSVLHNEDPVIRSDGTPLRYYLYIEDAVDVYLSLAERVSEPKVQGEAFSIGAGKAVSVFGLVNKIIELSGNKGLKVIVASSSKNGRTEKMQRLDFSKAHRLLEWRPGHSLEEGLAKTIGWYRKYFKICAQ